MTELVKPFKCLSVESQNLKLVVVASTFMNNGFECVIGWSIKGKKLIRPVTNLERNSWISGTFTVGCKYKFVIVDSNPGNAIYPHKSEDIIVEENPVQVAIRGSVPRMQFTESEMYDMLFGSSVDSVSSVFDPGVIHGRKYIIEETNCPSVGILRCKVEEIEMYEETNPGNPSRTSKRCRISQGVETFDFPVTAQNRDALMTVYSQPSAEYANNPILVLLGLGRPFAGDNNSFDPLRCYILLIGVIRPPVQQEE